MRALRAAWCTAACALGCFALASVARAEAAPKVVVISTALPDARLSRVLRLIRGELAGLGLDAELREEPAPATVAAAPSGAYGALVIEASEAAISVRAFAPGDPKPVTESIDLDSAGVDAEVVAVRAVETLRAALLPFAQAHRSELSPVAREFARVAEPVKTKHATPEATTQAATQSASASATRGAVRDQTPWVELAIGPSLILNSSASPMIDAQAALLIGPSWGFLALAGESTLRRAELNGRGGRAEVTRWALSGAIGGRLQLRRSFELSSRLGIGYVSYAVRGIAQPGYLAQDLEHRSAAGSLTLSGAYYLLPAVGVYLSASGQVAFDAARVRVAERDVGTLDQPSLALAAGALIGLF